MEAVKAEWMKGISRFSFKQIGVALDHFATKGGSFPPSLPEFLAVCRDLDREPDHLALPRIMSREDVQRSKDMMAAAQSMLSGETLNIDAAKRIEKRAALGDKVPAKMLEIARESIRKFGIDAAAPSIHN